MNHAEALRSKVLSQKTPAPARGSTVPLALLQQMVKRLRAVRRQFAGPILTAAQRAHIAAQGISSNPALDDAYQRLLRQRPDLAQRSVPPETFAQVTANKVVLSSIGDAAEPLALGLLQVTTDVGQELRRGNQRLLSALDMPIQDVAKVLPNTTPARLRNVFRRVMEEQQRQGRKGLRRGQARLKIDQTATSQINQQQLGLMREQHVDVLRQAAKSGGTLPVDQSPTLGHLRGTTAKNALPAAPGKKHGTAAGAPSAPGTRPKLRGRTRVKTGTGARPPAKTPGKTKMKTKRKTTTKPKTTKGLKP